MPNDLVSILVLVVTSAITFGVARLLGRKWRQKQRDEAASAKRAGESRQVRRARERGERK
jgi:hypothetical protein